MIVFAAVKEIVTVGKPRPFGHPQFCHKLPQIGICTPGIQIQRFFKKAIRFFPIAILQGHKAPVKLDTLAVISRGHHLLNHLLHWGARVGSGQKLLNAPHQILDRPHLAHVLGLELGEFLGHVIGVDALVAGNQVLCLVLGHELEVAAPLILDPHGVVVFIIRAEGQHDLRAVQGGEDVRLVFLAQLVLQGDAGEEYPVALFRQGVIDILGNDTVHGAFAVFVRLLVADENIIRLLLAGDLDDALADLLDLLGLLPVDLAGDHIGVLLGLLKVGILQNAVKAGAMAGGNLFAGGRVIHVLDAVLAQHQAPVGFRLLGEIGDDGLINARRLIKLTAHAQPVGTGKQRQLFLIVLVGNGLPGAAVFALGHGRTRLDHQIAAAHFTFNHCHCYFPLFLSSQFPYAPGQIPGSWP